jgi:hypothetical protein
MLTVPFRQVAPSQPVAPPPPPTYTMMAAAQMHDEGRLLAQDSIPIPQDLKDDWEKAYPNDPAKRMKLQKTYEDEFRKTMKQRQDQQNAPHKDTPPQYNWPSDGEYGVSMNA